ncbi:hypothetical protein BCP8-2_113 [Bacillus phage BCP8-2]|uniref:Uncharacterized protein n=1 Tax=Bacillus phage BCP8-2 TaxID=1129192 RepID=A0A0E3D9G4_9CAUD|nr:hypothetical protein BCP8-2_113 [Bacillus phage BCP8-2]AHJ87151.1 hypothetical protein BCP8-2_113 [Bacillus phage BCP8-2]
MKKKIKSTDKCPYCGSKVWEDDFDCDSCGQGLPATNDTDFINWMDEYDPDGF